jgi:triphosphoribosyl-dephospho-CoA synthetase
MPHPAEYAQTSTRSWTTRRSEKKRRTQLVSSWMNGPLLPREKLVEALESLIVPGDRVVIEGDNQKQADLLSRSLASTDPRKLHDLHLIISSISRPEHLTLFELGIAKKIDFAFSSEEVSRLDALLSIMSRLDDTCVLYRGGLEALNAVQSGAQAVLTAGGYGTAHGRNEMRKLDEELIARHVSPGGSADLLAATIFLDAVERQQSEIRKDHSESEVSDGTA